VREIFWGGSSVLGIREETTAGILQVLNLNPQPSGKRRLRHPREFKLCLDNTVVAL
jgi:hypothetical protein